MARNRPRTPAPSTPVYVISVAAELTGLHPQTLRQYDRIGLVTPGRSGGGGRRYSLNDIELLREVAELTAAGIGLEGVRRILDLKEQVRTLRYRNTELARRATELGEALESALVALADSREARRPNLPAIRREAVLRRLE